MGDVSRVSKTNQNEQVEQTNTQSRGVLINRSELSNEVVVENRDRPLPNVPERAPRINTENVNTDVMNMVSDLGRNDTVVNILTNIESVENLVQPIVNNQMKSFKPVFKESKINDVPNMLKEFQNVENAHLDNMQTMKHVFEFLLEVSDENGQDLLHQALDELDVYIEGQENLVSKIPQEGHELSNQEVVTSIIDTLSSNEMLQHGNSSAKLVSLTSKLDSLFVKYNNDIENFKNDNTNDGERLENVFRKTFSPLLMQIVTRRLMLTVEMIKPVNPDNQELMNKVYDAMQNLHTSSTIANVLQDANKSGFIKQHIPQDLVNNVNLNNEDPFTLKDLIFNNNQTFSNLLQEKGTSENVNFIKDIKNLLENVKLRSEVFTRENNDSGVDLEVNHFGINDFEELFDKYIDNNSIDISRNLKAKIQDSIENVKNQMEAGGRVDFTEVLELFNNAVTEAYTPLHEAFYEFENTDHYKEMVIPDIKDLDVRKQLSALNEIINDDFVSLPEKRVASQMKRELLDTFLPRVPNDSDGMKDFISNFKSATYHKRTAIFGGKINDIYKAMDKYASVLKKSPEDVESQIESLDKLRGQVISFIETRQDSTKLDWVIALSERLGDARIALETKKQSVVRTIDISKLDNIVKPIVNNKINNFTTVYKESAINVVPNRLGEYQSIETNHLTTINTMKNIFEFLLTVGNDQEVEDLNNALEVLNDYIVSHENFISKIPPRDHDLSNEQVLEQLLDAMADPETLEHGNKAAKLTSLTYVLDNLSNKYSEEMKQFKRNNREDANVIKNMSLDTFSPMFVQSITRRELLTRDLVKSVNPENQELSQKVRQGMKNLIESSTIANELQRIGQFGFIPQPVPENLVNNLSYSARKDGTDTVKALVFNENEMKDFKSFVKENGNIQNVNFVREMSSLLDEIKQREADSEKGREVKDKRGQVVSRDVEIDLSKNSFKLEDFQSIYDKYIDNDAITLSNITKKKIERALGELTNESFTGNRLEFTDLLNALNTAVNEAYIDLEESLFNFQNT